VIERKIVSKTNAHVGGKKRRLTMLWRSARREQPAMQIPGEGVGCGEREVGWRFRELVAEKEVGGTWG